MIDRSIPVSTNLLFQQDYVSSFKEMALARGSIDADADKVVRKLARHGHKAYLVGGCVRDLLLHRTPKDFDVATSATPGEIRDLFRNCRIVGRRFRLAHIFFGPKVIETSTFRANPREGQGPGGELLIRRDNVFGSATEDARRRDFTINGLFYDVATRRVIDYVGGMEDLRAGLVRTIGNPHIRFQEDPVRMLRAIKFAARLGFEIEPETYQALLAHRNKISKCSAPRVLEEFYRLLRGGAARRSMELLGETGLDMVLAPRLASMFRRDPDAASSNETACADRDAGDGGETAEETRDEEKAEWFAMWDVSQDDDDSDEPDDEDDADDADDDESDDEAQDALDDETGLAAAAHDELDDETDDELDDAAGACDLSPPPVPPLALSFLPEADLRAARKLAWNVLTQLDELIASGREPSNALILATLINPFLSQGMTRPGIRPSEANAMIMELSTPLIQQLRIARRDAERMRQILLAQRRLAPSRRRRGRPMALVRRDYFDDALAVYEMTARAAGGDIADVERWLQMKSRDSKTANGSNTEASKKRRRRRGGRRRRRTSSDADDLEATSLPIN